METKNCVLNGKIAEKVSCVVTLRKASVYLAAHFKNKMTGETAFTWEEVKLIGFA